MVIESFVYRPKSDYYELDLSKRWLLLHKPVILQRSLWKKPN